MKKLQELTELLKTALRKGDYPVGSKFPSEYELANCFGVNRITASKSVNLLIKDGYLERAGSTRAGTIVRMLRPYPEGLIAFMGHLNDSYSSGILNGAIRAATRKNYLLSVFSPAADEISDSLSKMESGRFSGIINLHYGQISSGIPTVYVDDSRMAGRKDCPAIMSDTYKGAALIVENLIKKGHRNIAFLTKKYPGDELDLRTKGCIAAMKSNGIADAEARSFFYNDNSVHHSGIILKQMLNAYPELTAIICNTDHSAFNMISAAREMGLDIPGKISVTGFGNINEIQRTCKLMTIDQHPFELGSRAVEKLIEIIEGNDNGELIETIDIEFIEGNSVSRIN